MNTERPACLRAGWILLMLFLSVPAGHGEPLTPQRILEEIHWQEGYTVEEVRQLVYAVALMYQDEVDRAVREATGPLRVELEDLRAAAAAGTAPRRRAPAADPALAADLNRAAAAAAERGAPPPGRAPANLLAKVERDLRTWRTVGIAAIVVGIAEAVMLAAR
jgi:hypothetical protein